MGITPRFNPADVAKKFDGLLNIIQNETVRALQYVGEEAVKYARTAIPDPDHGGKGFKDDTGNLRSSIGYAIYHNGKQIDASYGKGLGDIEETPKGTQQGQTLADKAAEGTRGFALVVTAGMYYAVYVESKGRDVLTSAEQMAAQWLQTELDDIKQAVIEYWKEK